MVKTALPKTVEFKFSNCITFLGGESHFPNKDGIEWFIHGCWPKIKISNPSLKLLIIGKWSEDTINKYGKDSTIEFSGFVDDLASILENSIFIVPIRIGSGVRMKIIEAINHNCPIISTSVGIEGLNFINEVDYLKADNENLIIQQVIRLIENPNLCIQLIQSCKNTLEQNYSYTELIDKRRSVYS
jgi:glycosyltransferase involved in cell wall biosynthesis